LTRTKADDAIKDCKHDLRAAMTLEFQYIFAGKGIGPGKIDCDPTINDTFVIIEKIA
jgi:hypothetical protein